MGTNDLRSPITHTITATAGQHGSIIMPNDVTVLPGETNSVTVEHGTDATFTIVPDEGYEALITVDGEPITPTEGVYQKEADGSWSVYDEQQDTYRPIDDAPFVVVLSANGGMFNYNKDTQESWAPKIKVRTCRYKAANGEMKTLTNVPMPDYYVDDGTMLFAKTQDGQDVFLWALFYDDCTELTIGIENLPYPDPDNPLAIIESPSGFSNIDKWEMVAPYYSTSDSGLQVVLDRVTVDNTRQVTMMPQWVPSRNGNLRAIAVASGLGSLDFGAIQSVSTTYNSKLTVLPIVCYGYTGTFCMDLGVTKTVSLSYIRVSPENPESGGYDSRKWSNSEWIKKLRDFTDRWQMRTNGCTLYLKRPDLDRLRNGFDDPEGSSDPGDSNYYDFDPMKPYIEEINGENCYISSAPIKYAVGRPNVISSTITFTMGTLYPKQTPIGMVQVTLQWGDERDNTQRLDKNVYLLYPKGTAAIAPSIPYLWGFIYNTEKQAYEYISSLYYYDNNKKISLSSGTYFTPTANMIIYGEVANITGDNIRVAFEPGSGNYKVKPISAQNETILTYILIGGGGGGGSAYVRRLPSTITGYDQYGSGGGGGSAGQYNSQSVTLSNTTESLIPYTVGEGGKGGESRMGVSNVTSENGYNGGFTSITVNNTPIYAWFGYGGPRAKDENTPGVWNNEYANEITPPITIIGNQRIGDNGYIGGNGGQGGLIQDIQPGGAGKCDESLSNGGAGGSFMQSGSYIKYHVGGGGGGGGAVFNVEFPLDPPREGQGGSGLTAENNVSIHGTYGSGGGGGGGSGNDKDNTHYSGGKGGDGLVVLIVTNGTFI